MNSTVEFRQFLPYLNDLKKFLKKKLKTDIWQDVYQETICYILSSSETVIVDNPKGYLISTSKFFISKERTYSERWKTDGNQKDIKASVKSEIVFDTSTGFNGFLIDDDIFNRMKSISHDLYRPLQMQFELEMSIKQIASELGLNENTVKTRIRRAKEYLKSKT